MKTIKGPAIFLAQFMGDEVPFDNLAHLAGWAAGLGFKGIQVPCDPRLIDLDKAATSDAYCDELRETADNAGVTITELSTHLQGQLVAVHPAYDTLFDGFAAPQVRGNPAARTQWASAQMKLAAQASRRLGLTTHVSFSGALAWPYLYPWPQRPAGLVEAAFDEPVNGAVLMRRLIHEGAAVELPRAAPRRGVVVLLRPRPEDVDGDRVDAPEAAQIHRLLQQLQRLVAAVLLDDEQAHASLVAGAHMQRLRIGLGLAVPSTYE